jgi:hypothetical protein
MRKIRLRLCDVLGACPTPDRYSAALDHKG